MSDQTKLEEDHRYVREELEKLRAAMRAKDVAPREWAFGLLAEALGLAGAMDDLEWLDETYRLMFERVRQKLNDRKNMS